MSGARKRRKKPIDARTRRAILKSCRFLLEHYEQMNEAAAAIGKRIDLTAIFDLIVAAAGFRTCGEIILADKQALMRAASIAKKYEGKKK